MKLRKTLRERIRAKYKIPVVESRKCPDCGQRVYMKEMNDETELSDLKREIAYEIAFKDTGKPNRRICACGEDYDSLGFTLDPSHADFTFDP